MPRRILIGLVAALALALPAGAHASPYIQYGIQDDAWLIAGPGHGDGSTIEERVLRLKALGVKLVRFNIRWNEVAATRPARPANHLDPAYRWDHADALLPVLRSHGITAVVTIVGAPRWANGGRTPNWAPTNATAFGNFAFAAATRYHWVRHWVMWNEPNKYWQLRPTTTQVYVQRILNPGHDAIKRVNRANRVAGGVTAPTGGAGSVTPVNWIRAMKRWRPRMDAYAHHPYPANRGESPLGRGCGASCQRLTMADLPRLVTEVRRAFGNKRIWLTEYGVQTNPPDRWLGVSPAVQARYLSEASLRAYQTPFVDMLIQFLVYDEAGTARWQSGLYTVSGAPKLSASAFPYPLAQVWRRGNTVRLWGQVRPGDGRRAYRLRMHHNGRWTWATPARLTGPGGMFFVNVNAPRGAHFQLVSGPAMGAALAVR